MEDRRTLKRMDLTAVDSVAALVKEVDTIKTTQLTSYGAVLLHTSQLKTAADFESFLVQADCQLMEYEFGSTPRSQLEGRVYSSTEYPNDETIVMHNEMAYTTSWPNRLWFFCETAAATGGETPVADSREIYRKIDPAIRQTFEEKGLLYVRNYRAGIDVPWQQVFNTQDKAQVVRYCEASGIHYEWNDDELKTTQKCQSVVTHPVTGDTVWFNQAHLFHISSMSQEYQELLRSLYQEDELPRNVLFGDGTPIDGAMLDEVREVFVSEKQLFSWSPGDVLLLDNLLFAHGREPYTGARKIAVAME